jgi:uncharacterized Fe-S cluster-containing radical SAM superfamily protein
MPSPNIQQATVMSSELVHTPIDEIAQVCSSNRQNHCNVVNTIQIRGHVRESFRAGKAKSVAFRKEQLLQLAYLIQDNLEPFQVALRKDLGRSAVDANL